MDQESKSSRRASGDADNGEAAFLSEIAERVRSTRVSRGMTRKMLARHSGVSERYLAQLESGRGNASIIVLRKVAQAMDCPIDELLAPSAERPIEFRLVAAMLERLSAEELREARALLSQHFSEPAHAKKAVQIALVGLRGAGKSTLGRRLADHLQIPFVELNALVEREYGAPIGEILELSGQRTYRRYERRILERILEQYDRAVIGTGGGIVTEPATLDLLLRNTVTVWLQASPEEHMNRVIAQGDLRPISDNREAMEELKQVLASRTPFYRQAQLSLNTSGKSEDESLNELVELLAAHV